MQTTACTRVCDHHDELMHQVANCSARACTALKYGRNTLQPATPGKQEVEGLLHLPLGKHIATGVGRLLNLHVLRNTNTETRLVSL